MRPAIVSALSAVAFAIAGFALPIVFPQVDPVIARWMLGFCAGLLLLATTLWLLGLNKSELGNTPVTPTTTNAHQSPAIGSVTGPVNIHYNSPPPAATQHQKPSYAEPTPHETAKPTISTEKISQPQLGSPPRRASTVSPKPDLPLGGLLVRIYAALGPVPNGERGKQLFRERVNLAIADKVVGESLHTWGRQGKRALTPIDPDSWTHGIFDHQKKALTLQAAYSRDYDLTDLHFWKNEIERIWPEPHRIAKN